MEIAERPTNTPDYFEAVHDEDEGSESDYTKDHNSFARLVITATVIFSILLIIVVIAIICKFTYWLMGVKFFFIKFFYICHLNLMN